LLLRLASADDEAAAGELPLLHQLQRLRLEPSGMDGLVALTEVLSALKGLPRVEAFTARMTGLPSAVLGGARAITDTGDPASLLLQLEASVKLRIARKIAAVAPSLPMLKRLDLWYCSIGADGCRALAAALPQLPHLRDLVLEQCDIDDACMQALMPGVRDTAQLQLLSLNDNIVTLAGVQALTAAMPHCRHLRVLRMGGNPLDWPGIEAIAQVVPLTPTLQEVRFDHVGFDATHAAGLAPRVVLVPHLLEFDVSGNPLGDAGVGMVMAWLTFMPFLRALYLYQVGITQWDAAWASCLACVSHLEVLDISVNDLSRGTADFASALMQLPALKTLDVSSARLQGGAFSHLCRALARCPGLEELSVADNAFGDAGAAVLASACRKLKQLRYLDASCNGTTAAGARLLDAWWREGRQRGERE
jgi:Ran GTPase-activating protein (RanGAP) involved in mRNA processing and transport